MPTSFIELSDKIDLNEKRLEFEYERYEGYYSRFTFVSILYSILAIYFLQLVKFCFNSQNNWKATYGIVFIIFCALAIYSVYHAVRLLMPKDISFLKLPREFYINIRQQYENKGINDEALLNEYIKATYNDQLEQIVASNAQLSADKGMHYFQAFWSALAAIPFYLICTCIYLSCPNDPVQNIELKNYPAIFHYMDSTQKQCPLQKKDTTLEACRESHNMEKDKKIEDKKDKEKTPKIDSSKVIRSEPMIIREGKSVNIKK